MTHMHRLPEHADRERWSQEPEPVRVTPPKDWNSMLGSLFAGRQNLLTIWPQRAYVAQTLALRLFRQNYFLCNSPDTVRRVFLDEHDNYDRKSPQMREALEPLVGDGLFVSDGALWKERRAYCAPAFESELMPGYARTISECAGQTAAQWAAQPADQPLDMLHEMARLTARIIGRTVFGDDTSDEEAAQVVQGFSDYQRHVDQMRLASSLNLPLLRFASNPVRRWKSQQSARQVQSVIDRIIARHQPRQGRFTLMSLFLEGSTRRQGEQAHCPLHPVAARNEAMIMFMAGHETTANSLAWTWYLLDHNPRVAARLHEELDQVLQGRTPTWEDVARLPYTRAVFEEALRLYPPVPLLSRQARQADSMRDKPITPDAIILVIPWLLHRHELYWELPNHFIPERFLDHERPDKFIYLPFSVGRRVCLGLRFGLTEGILCLATLAQRFEARLAPGHQVDIECRLTLRPKDGLPMYLSPRAPAAGQANPQAGP